jgi:hypothetical protein
VSKYVRVNIEAVFKVPDDARIVSIAEGEEEADCLTVNGEQFICLTDWLKRDLEKGWWSSFEMADWEEEVVVRLFEDSTYEEITREEFVAQYYDDEAEEEDTEAP